MKAQPLISTYLPAVRNVGKLAVRNYEGRDVFSYDDIANALDSCSYGRIAALYASNKSKFEKDVDSGYATFNGQKFRWFSPAGLVKMCLLMRTPDAISLLKQVCLEWPEVANPKNHESIVKPATDTIRPAHPPQSQQAIPSIEQQMQKTYKMFIICTSEPRPSDSNEHERKFHVVAEDISKAIAAAIEHVEKNLKAKHVSVVYAAFHEHISIVAP